MVDVDSVTELECIEWVIVLECGLLVMGMVSAKGRESRSLEGLS